MISAGRVRLGVESLQKVGPGSLDRVGLLSNQSAILPDGTPTWRALREAGFPVVRLFGPEHGFAAQAQDAIHVGDATYREMELISLYGERSRPEPRHLRDLDAVIIDIQEIGCRYYTYLYTAAGVIEECNAEGVQAIVCDRPNPIGAATVEGGALRRESASEVGDYGLTQRHGLTIGEFSRYLTGGFARSRAGRPGGRGGSSAGTDRESGRRPSNSGPAATVFWMEGYDRGMLYGNTGLPWKQPSPNLPSPETALVYPGTCLFEGTNISEGRGTTRPFETIGAPWIDAEELRDELAGLSLPGVVFSVVDFTPTFSKFGGESCRGVQLHVTDPAGFQPLGTGIELLHAIRAQAPERFAWRPLWEDASRSFVDRLAGGEEFRHTVDRGASSEEAYGVLIAGCEEYLAARREAIHYTAKIEV